MSAPLSAPSQLLLRHLAELPAGSLLLEPAIDGLVSALTAAGRPPGAIATLYRSVYEALRTQVPAGTTLAYGAPPDGARFPAALIHLPREKALARWVVQEAASRTRPGGMLWVVGENRAGGRSGGTRLAPFCRDVRKVDVARRSSLFTGCCEDPPAPPSVDAAVRWFDAPVPGPALRLAALPGVFAEGRLDEGTALLLEHLPRIRGEVLDFGCGCGVIGAFVARRDGSRVTLVDDFALACAAAEATFAANGLAGRVIAANGLAGAPGAYDWIVTNPPFHRGARNDYTVTQQLLDEAPARLARGGTLVLVGNRFLPWARHLRARFERCEMLAETGRYHVLAASQPRCASPGAGAPRRGW